MSDMTPPAGGRACSTTDWTNAKTDEAWTDGVIAGKSRKGKRPLEPCDEAQEDKGARHCALDFSVAAACDDGAAAGDSAKDGEDTDTEEDAQTLVDRAFAAFISTHKLELGIFRSSEWSNLLAAANESCYNEPTTLLARAPIHLSNEQAMANLAAEEGHE